MLWSASQEWKAGLASTVRETVAELVWHSPVQDICLSVSPFLFQSLFLSPTAISLNDAEYLAWFDSKIECMTSNLLYSSQSK